MQTFYTIAVGPLAWFAWAVFLVGSAWRVFSMASLAKSKEMAAVAYLDAGYGMRPIARWMTPFATLGWQKNPVLTLATFAFHISFILLALFAQGHAILWEYAFGVRVWALPPQVASALTIIATLSCAYFLVRRLGNATVRFVSTPGDWLALCLATLPFITALLVSQNVGDPLLMTLLHVLSGEAVLIAIPFTRLSHALFVPFTRAYMGSEFGAVRHCPDW